MATLPIKGASADAEVAATRVQGKGAGGHRVCGVCAPGPDVHGDSTSARGVVASSRKFHGVGGKSVENSGVVRESPSTLLAISLPLTPNIGSIAATEAGTERPQPAIEEAS